MWEIFDRKDKPLTETERTRMRDDISRYGMAAAATWTDRQVRQFNNGALEHKPKQ